MARELPFNAVSVCLCMLAVASLTAAAEAHPVRHRQFTVKGLIKDVQDFSKLFYQHILAPRLLQLRYKLTRWTYRLANLIFRAKTLWRVATRPLHRAHARLASALSPLIQQLAGRSLSTADRQLLAQALALALPLLALLVVVRVLGAAWRRRRQRQRH